MVPGSRKRLRVVDSKKRETPTGIMFDLFMLLIVAGLAVMVVYDKVIPIKHTPVLEEPTLSDIIEDGQIDDNEAQYLSSMDCYQVKKFLGINKSGCIYLTDENGDRVFIGNKAFVGCDSDICKKA